VMRLLAFGGQGGTGLLRNGACTPTGIPSLTISSMKRLGLEIRLAVSTTKGHVSSSVVPEQTRPYVRTTRPFTCIKLMRSITDDSCSQITCSFTFQFPNHLFIYISLLTLCSARSSPCPCSVAAALPALGKIRWPGAARGSMAPVLGLWSSNPPRGSTSLLSRCPCRATVGSRPAQGHFTSKQAKPAEHGQWSAS